MVSLFFWFPQGASFGYHAGGWGKPPVDEAGKPLYGDVFGSQQHDVPVVAEEEEIDRTPWGELESEESSEEESVKYYYYNINQLD